MTKAQQLLSQWLNYPLRHPSTKICMISGHLLNFFLYIFFSLFFKRKALKVKERFNKQDLQKCHKANKISSKNIVLHYNICPSAMKAS